MAQPWTLLSTHGLVLLAIARRPDIRLREIAEEVGITPRAAQNLVNALVVAGYVERERDGRRNHYVVRGDQHLPHPTTASFEAIDLFGGLLRAVGVRPSKQGPRALVLACSDFR